MRHADMIKRRMWARSGCNRRLETDLRKSIEQCQNALPASLTAIDDRLRHGAAQLQPRKLT